MNAESWRNSDCQFSSVDCQKTTQNASDQNTASCAVISGVVRVVEPLEDELPDPGDDEDRDEKDAESAITQPVTHVTSSFPEPARAVSRTETARLRPRYA